MQNMRKNPIGGHRFTGGDDANSPRRVVVPKGAKPIPVVAAAKTAVEEKNNKQIEESVQVVEAISNARPIMSEVSAEPMASASCSLPENQPMPKRPRFEESHRRRTIYLENKLDYKVQAICASHPLHRSMTGLIHAALTEYIQTHQL